jgi:hypothetical protein
VPSHSRPPKQGPLPEAIQVAAACNTEMARKLAVLQTAVSSVTHSMLWRSPTEAFQADVVGGDAHRVPGVGGATITPRELWHEDL